MGKGHPSPGPQLPDQACCGALAESGCAPCSLPFVCGAWKTQGSSLVIKDFLVSVYSCSRVDASFPRASGNLERAAPVEAGVASAVSQKGWGGRGPADSRQDSGQTCRLWMGEGYSIPGAVQGSGPRLKPFLPSLPSSHATSH